eukprot:TRINITY_DN1631_c0_g1_i1.p1 TRINITY_DN1631_c0_g1~~TRINITY_DN1631_c0_g1_i1.p1  ORF type:complete len:214 (+),score=34.68 TRINITY_DN1631_c0_g1_i1:37-678(+)
MNPVFLWAPNLIDYGRVVANVIAFACAFHSVWLAAFFYVVGQLLDAVDGTVARALGQTSRFGQLMDMLSDRMSTATLSVCLAVMYPQYWGFYAFLIVLDIVSHWFQMYSKATSKSHKDSKNPLLHFYYTFPYALLVFCVGNEAFFICMYILHFTAGPIVPGVGLPFFTLLAYVVFPIFFAKQFMNFVQLYDAANEIAAVDYENWKAAQAEKKH